MSALHSLIAEHHQIIRLTGALLRYADLLEAEGKASREHLRLFAMAFADMVDAVHHEKEESVLLPFLACHGFSWDDGALKEVRGEHRLERYLLDVLHYASLQTNDWSTEDRRRVVATIRALAHFQRGHLNKENVLLFPEVLRRLSASELAELQAELEEFDQQCREAGQLAPLQELFNSLVESYPVVPNMDDSGESPRSSPGAAETEHAAV